MTCPNSPTRSQAADRAFFRKVKKVMSQPIAEATPSVQDEAIGHFMDGLKEPGAAWFLNDMALGAEKERS
jgi:hypothetical protein